MNIDHLDTNGLIWIHGFLIYLICNEKLSNTEKSRGWNQLLVRQLLFRIYPFHLKCCSSYILAPQAPFKVERVKNKKLANEKRLQPRKKRTLRDILQELFHFFTRLFYFWGKFRGGDARNAAIAELKLKAEQSKCFVYILLAYTSTLAHTETYYSQHSKMIFVEHRPRH